MNDNEAPKTESESRIDKILSEAQEAFWEVIADGFPYITTGDFPPDATIAFDLACTRAVKTWVECNYN